MKTVWKWVLGIVIVLVVIAALGVGARLLMANYLPRVSADVDGFNFPMMGGRGYDHFGGMRIFGGGMRMFGGGFGMFGGLLPLVLLGLLVYGAYHLGTRKFMAQPGTVVPATVRTCTKCGQQVQETWNNCPNCGKKI